MTFASRTVNGLRMSMGVAMTVAVTLAASAAYVASAQAADATLIDAADGASFTVGGTPYQVVTRARAERGGATAVAGVASTVTVGTIGDYTITLPATVSAPPSDYLVAVNRRTGSPVLVSNHLKLFGVTTAQAASVASSTGGAVDSLVTAASMAMLAYPSPAAALAAKTVIESRQGGEPSGAQAALRVEPEVIQAFKTPR